MTVLKIILYIIGGILCILCAFDNSYHGPGGRFR